MFSFMVRYTVVFLFAMNLPAQAQQPTKIPRIGVLQGGSAASSKGNLDAFREGMQELGWTEGKNIRMEYRYADGKIEKLPEIAKNLVKGNVDLILVGGTQTITAAKQATTTIPIVVGGAGDLVAAGLVSSLARPGETSQGPRGCRRISAAKESSF